MDDIVILPPPYDPVMIAKRDKEIERLSEQEHAMRHYLNTLTLKDAPTYKPRNYPHTGFLTPARSRTPQY